MVAGEGGWDGRDGCSQHAATAEAAAAAAAEATTKPGSVDLEPSRILPVAGDAGRKCVGPRVTCWEM